MIKITVSGKGRGSGKSFVAALMAKHLEDYGYTVFTGNVNPTVLPRLRNIRGFGSVHFEEVAEPIE